MTKDEFLKKYHEYGTHSCSDAVEEAGRANLEGVDNDRAVAVYFPKLGWCLMLESAYRASEKDGLVKGTLCIRERI